VLKVFKEIKEINLEAKKIIEEARVQVEKINREAHQKSSIAYETYYKKILKKADEEALELKREKEKDIENELKKTKIESEKIAKEVEVKSEKNFEKAVDYVFKIILGEK
jgi:hypothetical protein